MKIKKLFAFFAIIALYSTIIQAAKYTNIFNTLDEVKTFATSLEEYPEIENENTLRPKYTQFHTKNLPSWATRLLRFFKIRKIYWSAKKFKKLLKNVTKYRINNAYIGRFVIKNHPTSGTQLIIWGHLFGAFQSFVRSLDYLYQKKIIDNHFKILNKNHFFVLNGNAISMSPYSLETLTLILRLMETNPQQIIYIRGKHEDKEHWLNFGLKDELKIKAAGISSEKIPLQKDINRFFNTLPLALYLTSEQEKILKGLRISFHNRSYEELNELTFIKLFETKETALFNLRNATEPKKSNIDIESIIKGIDNIEIPIPKTGLSVVDPDKGATAFVLFSSPTQPYRANYEFFFDAFSIINIKEKFDDWTITLFNQDVRQQLGFDKQDTYNLISGNIVTKKEIVEKKAEQKIENLQERLAACQRSLKEKQEILKKIKKAPLDKKIKLPVKKIPSKKPKEEKEIRIGSTLDTTSPLSIIGNNIEHVLNNLIDKVNDAGGINGKEIELTILDDGYNPSQARKNIKELKNNFNTDIILSPLGGPTTYAYNKMIIDKKIAVFFPSTGFSQLRKPDFTYLINFGPGYNYIEKFSFTYAIEKEHSRKFAFFYQDDLAGSSIPTLVKDIDSQNYISVSYKRGALRLEKKAQQIRQFRPDVLFLWCTPAAAISLIRQIGPMNLTNTTLMGYRLGTKKLKTFLDENNILRQYIGIENVPNPMTSDLEIVKNFRNDIAEKYHDIYGLEAYITTSLFIYFLKQIKSPIKKEDIIKQIEKIKNFDFKGFSLHFDVQTRQVSNTIWIDAGQKNWQKVEMKKEKIPIVKKKEIVKKPIKEKEQKEILIGTSLDLTGANKVRCNASLKAMFNSFKKANNEGGIKGKKITLIEADDDYKAKRAKKNILNFMNNYGIDIIFNSWGSPTTESYLDLIEKGKILAMFPDTGAPSLHDPKYKYMIHAFPTYTQMDTTGIKYLIQNKNVKKIAFFYPESVATGKSTQIAIEKNKIKKDDYKIITYRTGQTNFQEQAEKIKNFEPDAIASFGTLEPTIALIKTIGAPNLRNTTILTEHEGGKKFVRFLKRINLLNNWVNIESIPNPRTSQLPIMKEYRRDTKKSDISAESAEAYIKTQIFIDILKKIKGPIQKKKIIDTVEKIKNYNFKGLLLHFDPKTRELYHDIWVEDGRSDDWIKFTIKNFK